MSMTNFIIIVRHLVVINQSLIDKVKSKFYDVYTHLIGEVKMKVEEFGDK